MALASISMLIPPAGWRAGNFRQAVSGGMEIRMKRGGVIWSAALAIVVAALLSPASRAVIIGATKSHPYAMGFIKFAILASMGELLAVRITGGEWKLPIGMIYRSVVWGGMGFCNVGMFTLLYNGTAAALASGMLPGGGLKSSLVHAIWASVALNLTFAPTMMISHRILDTYLDLAGGRLRRLPSIRMNTVIARIDWSNLIKFVCLKTVVLFWIPAHTVSFLLPTEYRILFAAALSVVLGVILAFAKRSRALAAGAGDLCSSPADAQRIAA